MAIQPGYASQLRVKFEAISPTFAGYDNVPVPKARTRTHCCRHLQRRFYTDSSEALAPARISSAYAGDLRRALGRVFRSLGRTGFRQRYRICCVPLRLSTLPRAGRRHARGAGSLEEAIRFADYPVTRSVCIREIGLGLAVSSPASQLPAPSSNLMRS